ncbi:MAG: hypothetical protein HQL16_04030 [Candidatus Omnitrophica bacterium]|nr:hypothetical protein [Candidatus Omnitrophota bacterium]
MKRLLGLTLVGLFLLALPGTVFAASLTKNFAVSATIPLTSSISINASSINSTTKAWTAVTGTALSFDPMTFNTTNGIFLPDHFFAIDAASSGTTGAPTVTMTYVEGTNPNGTGHGLGWKTSASFWKVTGSGTATTETGLTLGRKMLKDLAGTTVAPTDITGGWLRMYVGINTGDSTAVPPFTTDMEVFSNADKAGTYTGTLSVTATTP